MNVNCYYIVYFSVKSFYPHFKSFETYSCTISYCAAFYLSTFSHDAVRILASLELIAGGAPNCKMGELSSSFVSSYWQNNYNNIKHLRQNNVSQFANLQVFSVIGTVTHFLPICEHASSMQYLRIRSADLVFCGMLVRYHTSEWFQVWFSAYIILIKL